jgi:hypothetical protein
LETTGNGAAGSVFYNLQLTNLSRRVCTVRGYPGVSAVTLAGSQIGPAASREASQRPRTVTLAPGASATAVVRIVQAGDFSAAACRETTAAGLRVFPPGQRSSRLVPFPFRTCAAAHVRVLSVRSLQPAQGGPV